MTPPPFAPLPCSAKERPLGGIGQAVTELIRKLPHVWKKEEEKKERKQACAQRWREKPAAMGGKWRDKRDEIGVRWASGWGGGGGGLDGERERERE